MSKSVIKIIVNEVQDCPYISRSVDLTSVFTHIDQLCKTLRYVLPSSPIEKFVTFVPIKSHIGMGIVEVILTFLQKNLVDVKYYRRQSYGNASNMSCKDQDVQQRIKDVCSYAEFRPSFAHSLNLIGSCVVEANAAASNFFLMIQQL